MLFLNYFSNKYKFSRRQANFPESWNSLAFSWLLATLVCVKLLAKFTDDCEVYGSASMVGSNVVSFEKGGQVFVINNVAIRPC